MTEPIISIYADGKLAYTGFLNRAADRQGMRPNDLLVAIRCGHNLHQPALWKGGIFGGYIRVEPAKKYLGRIINT